MLTIRSRESGWHRDLPDHRDFSPAHPAVKAAFSRIEDSPPQSSKLPDHTDWREYCGPIDDQQDLASSASHACVGLLQYFERRSHGRSLNPSRLFVYQTARRLLGWKGDCGATLRATLQAIVRFGVPPEPYWPYDPSKLDAEPDGFAYGFGRRCAAIRYVRLDSAEQTGQQNLASLRAFLAAGFACVLGFPLCSSVAGEAEIPFPVNSDAVLSGHAVAVVGYNDRLRIRSDKGALLVRNSWGEQWGDGGYGWLPYSYVREKLAADIWTMLKPSWLRSSEFQHPNELVP